MSKVERFEDLIAWQKAHVLASDVYAMTRVGTFAKDFGLSGQIQRAAVSVMSNIAEGFDRHRPTEFHQFLSIAKGSCAELRSQLYIALDANHITRQQFDEARAKAEEISKILSGLREAVAKQIAKNSGLSTKH